MQTSWHKYDYVHIDFILRTSGLLVCQKTRKMPRAFCNKTHACKIMNTGCLIVLPIFLDCPFWRPWHPISTSSFYSSVHDIFYKLTRGSSGSSNEEVKTVAVGWNNCRFSKCYLVSKDKMESIQWNVQNTKEKKQKKRKKHIKFFCSKTQILPKI